mmetsp:Transcript_109444/g.193453  ORF Transcript_109444/g.193453 Transcript_109444/m.193453 type:complete len:235 (-) Transcript_109444:176-880(-)
MVSSAPEQLPLMVSGELLAFSGSLSLSRPQRVHFSYQLFLSSVDCANGRNRSRLHVVNCIAQASLLCICTFSWCPVKCSVGRPDQLLLQLPYSGLKKLLLIQQLLLSDSVSPGGLCQLRQCGRFPCVSTLGAGGCRELLPRVLELGTGPCHRSCCSICTVLCTPLSCSRQLNLLLHFPVSPIEFAFSRLQLTGQPVLCILCPSSHSLCPSCSLRMSVSRAQSLVPHLHSFLLHS